MAVGDATKIEFRSETDALTGAPVERLTDDAGDASMPYFNQVLFDQQGRMLVQSERSGSPQLYLLDLAAQTLLQLTDSPGGVQRETATLLPTRNQAVWFVGNDLWRVDCETFESEVIYRVLDGFHPSIASPSSDGASVTFATCEAVQTSIEAGRFSQYANFHEKLFRRPTSVIFRIDTATGAPQAVWGEREWISHVVVSPADADIVAFCHEGPWDRVQRLWRVKVSTGEVIPLIDHGRLISMTGHELFNDQGELVTQYSRRMTPQSKDWVHYNAVVDPDGRNERFWRFPAGMPTHIQASHGDPTLLCGDGAPVDESFKDRSKCIGLLRHGSDEQVAVTPLCRHDTSWKTQTSHPHPVFAPDDRYVYFNSDRAGTNAVYRVAVPS